MARSIPDDRFAAVVGAAARVFITHGYQRAQVADVADVLGLGKGTLYGYAQGRAALFAAAVRYGDGHEPLPPPEALGAQTARRAAAPIRLSGLAARSLSGRQI